MRQIGTFRQTGFSGSATIDIQISNVFGNSTWMHTFAGADANGAFSNILTIEYYAARNPDKTPGTGNADLVFKDDGSGTFEFVKEEVNKDPTNYFITNAITNGSLIYLLPVPPRTLLRITYAANVDIDFVNTSLSGS